MNAPQTPATHGQGKKAFQKSHGVKAAKCAPSHAARAALLILLIAAVSAAVSLPGFSAAAAGRPTAARVSAPRTALGPVATTAPAPQAAAARFAPVLLQALPAPIQTFGEDCSTPKSDWTLGQVVCVTVSSLTSPDRVLSRVQLVNPAGFVVDSLDVTSTSQTVSFTLPSATTYSFFGLTLDNRGTWRVDLVDTSDGGALATAPLIVHDPAGAVADIQISKSPVFGSQVLAGADVQSVIWVFNAGPDAASNVRVSDVPAPNTTFRSLTQASGPSFTCTTPAVGAIGTSLCTGASLANGEGASFIVTYRLNTGVADDAELSSSASVTSDTPDTSAVSNGSDESLTTDNPTPPACTMTCPENITVAAAQGQNVAVVNFAAPTLGGTCGAVTSTPASGSVFGIGTTIVTSSTADGQSCSFAVTVTPFQDEQAPSISCPSDITVNESSSSSNSATVNYTVSATDDSGSVTVDCDPPSGSPFTVGTTEVRCTATDPSGNTSSCNFNVTVNESACSIDANSPAPVPNVAQLPTITRSCSATLLAADDPNATDACGGTINADTASDRTYDAPGTYTVVWTYTDGAGQQTTQNQTVVILPDNSPPVPDEASLPTVTGECFASITGDAPTATDNCTGSGSVGVPLDPLSYTTVGTHVVRWKFTDPAGNSTIQNQTVIVTDTHAPSVTLNGPSTVTVECHLPYTDGGATAADNCAPPPTPTANSNVNVDVPGTYQVVWTATDAGGNSATATRTVVVVDTTKPVITLNGANPITILLHSAFVDPGASAADSCAGSFPATASGAVNTHAVGTYIITYNASDPSGNAADPVTRAVKVIYDFSGFFSPVGNPPTLNQVNAGRSIPVKFSLAGNQGLNVLAAGSPYSQQVSCGSNAPTDLQETGTAGNSSLTYDASTNQYVYVWKTEGSWAGTCRVLTVALNDGTLHTASFKFK